MNMQSICHYLPRKFSEKTPFNQFNAPILYIDGLTSVKLPQKREYTKKIT